LSSELETTTPTAGGSRMALLVLTWLWVAAPFGYGIYELIVKLKPLFGG
jgi:hypothetical protein